MNLHETVTFEVIMQTLGVLAIISIISVVLILQKAKTIKKQEKKTEANYEES